MSDRSILVKMARVARKQALTEIRRAAGQVGRPWRIVRRAVEAFRPAHEMELAVDVLRSDFTLNDLMAFFRANAAPCEHEGCGERAAGFDDAADTRCCAAHLREREALPDSNVHGFDDEAVPS